MSQLTSSPCTSGLRSGVSFISPAREKSRTTSAVETKYTTLHVDAIIFGILTETPTKKKLDPPPTPWKSTSVISSVHGHPRVV